MTDLTPESLREAQNQVEAYLDRTGVTGNGDPEKRTRRYLWTDAYAVLCCLGLYRARNMPCFREKALMVIEAVHDVLGHHREDDRRRGWISGLRNEEGRRHPTVGGLRIGKPLPEKETPSLPGWPRFTGGILSGRPPKTKAPDPGAEDPQEWERDGQYFHYLIRWIHALMRTVKETQGNGYLHMATELTEATKHFIGPKGIYWKMNIDLTRPVGSSMGAHDPLDGLVCVEALQRLYPEKQTGLEHLQRSFEQRCQVKSWGTTDSLGIGGLLLNLCRVLDAATAAGSPDLLPEPLQPDRLYRVTMQSLADFRESFDAAAPASRRLAFRECGLSLGLRVFLAKMNNGGSPRADPGELQQLTALADLIEEFWSRPVNQNPSSWTDHEDINTIMLSSSLIARTCPDVYG